MIDSIVRNVAGPYGELFGNHIFASFSKVFEESNEKDKERLDYLLSTWEARRLFARTELNRLRSFIGDRRVIESNYPLLKNALPYRKLADVSEYSNSFLVIIAV